MTLTRQHFELIAEMIRDGRESFKSNTVHARYAADVASRLASTNPLFDRGRFILACMPTAWVGSSKANVWERLARASKAQ
jgi:hypothetical protein